MTASFAKHLGLVALLALLTTPATAANYWPTAAYPSNQFGFGISSQQYAKAVVADGTGGYFVSWDDGYGGHVQHMLADGSTAWPWYVYEPEGATGGYMNPALALDGFGGVLLAYETHGIGGDELRLQRVAANGAPQPGWPAEGVSVSPSTDYDYLADVVADGEGGAFVSFIRSGPYLVHVQHVRWDGTLDPAWPATGVQVQKDGPAYTRPRVFRDGEGGALLVYHSNGLQGSWLFASRVDRFGVKRIDVFPDNGLLLGAAVAYSTFDAVQTGDGLVGVVWSDGNEVRIDVIDGNGRTGAAPPGGLALSNSPAVADNWPVITTNVYRDFLVSWMAGSVLMGARRQQDLTLHPEFPGGSAVVASNGPPAGYTIAIDADATGGMVVSWHDPTAFDLLRVQHLSNTGGIAYGWAAAGETLATHPSGIDLYPAVVYDDDGGAIGVFRNYNMLATNRVRRDGGHGRYRPALFTALNDVPNDQGGRLALYWRASEIDTVPANPVGSYMLWRRMPPIAAQARLERGARALAAGESPEAAGPGAIRVLSGAPVTAYWEYLGSTPARGWAGYGATISTNSDMFAFATWFPWEAFMLETVSPSGAVLATSLPDSGFSMDNRSPAYPAAFAAVRAGGATHLSWQPNAEPDLRDYRLHRGTSVDFVPSDANLVAAPTGTSYDDVAAPGFFYKLAATDVHGNSSHFALVTPAQTLDAPPPAAAELAFAPVAPNPARELATLAFALPTAGPAQLAVYDAQGRRVRTLLDGARPAGRQAVAWDLRDDGGRTLAPGLYLARLVTPAGTRVQRLAIVE